MDPWSWQMLLIQGQDCGSDLDSVESLIRRHEELEREVGIIQERSKVSKRVYLREVLWSWSNISLVRSLDSVSS